MSKEIEMISAPNKQRTGFTQVYNGFIDTDLLTSYEKMVFILIKSYADRKSGEAFPSLTTISAKTGISVSQVRRSIERLEKLGILTVQRRRSTKYGNIQNLYTIHDSEKRWMPGRAEELENTEAMIAEELTDEALLAELRKRGYIVPKEKEPASDTDQSTDTDPKNISNIITINNHSNANDESQAEKYSMEEIKQKIGYEYIAAEHDSDKNLIDWVFNVIYDTLNGDAATVKIKGLARPRSGVEKRFLELTPDAIWYSITQFLAVPERPKYPDAWIKSQLHTAVDDLNADIAHKVAHYND